jgi:hypothetical protein
LELVGLLDKYSVAMVGIIGTVAGVAITGWLNLKIKDKEATNAIRLKRLENSLSFQTRYLVEPVIAFLEADLRLISDVYGRGMENDFSDRKPELSEHVRLLAMTEARLRTFGDKALEDSFRLFTRKRLEVGNEILDDLRRDPNAAYEKLQEAIRLASEILASIQRTLERA